MMKFGVKSLAVCVLAALISIGAFSFAALAAEGTSLDTAQFTPIRLNETAEATISTGGNNGYFSFVPEKTGYYTFSSSGDKGTCGVLYGADKKQVCRDPRSGPSYCFSFSCKLTAGETYYLETEFYNRSLTGSFPVMLKEAPSSGSFGDGMTWIVSQNTLTISGSGDMKDFSMDAPWYGYREDIVSVVISDGITGIGDDAFFGFSALEQASIPNSVTRIGSNAFQGCKSLTAVTVPNVVSVGSFAFASCKSLTKVSLPRVTSVGSYAFEYCANLKSVALGSELTAISNSMFSDCKALEEITLPDSVKTIGKSAFYNCSGLMEISLPAGLVSIGEAAFYQCYSLKSVTVPGGVERVEKQTFAGCTQLAEVSLKAGVRIIGEQAFQKCVNLKRIVIPDTVTSIQNNAFSGCKRLETAAYGGTEDALQIDSGNGWLRRVFGEPVIESGACGPNAVWTLSSQKVLTISGQGDMENYESIENLPGRVGGTTTPWFQYDGIIDAIIIENGITSVGDYAFALIESPSQIRLASTITKVGDYAFYETNIAEFSFSDGLISIGRLAFCFSRLRSIDLPVSLKQISEYAFNHTYSLTYVNYGGTQDQWDGVGVSEGNEHLLSAHLRLNGGAAFGFYSGSCGENVTWSLNETGVLTIRGSGEMADYRMTKVEKEGVVSDGTTGYENDYITDAPWYDYIRYIREIVVEPGVTRIGNAAFFNCFNAQSVSLPDTLLSIGNRAFQYSLIPSVTMPDSVENMGFNVFYGCANLTEVHLSSGLKSIPSGTFQYCASLKKLVIPEGVESIGNEAFASCGLVDVTFPATVKKLSSWPAELMGLTSGVVNRGTVLRFLGPVPDGLPNNALRYIEVIYCPAAYYEDYKELLLPYMLSIAPNSYDADTLFYFGTLCTGDAPAELNYGSLTLNEENLSARLSASVSGTTDGVSVKWRSSNSDLLQVASDGSLLLLGGSGGALVYAEVTYQGNTSLVFCPVKFIHKQQNSMLVNTLPTSGIRSNYLATCNRVGNYLTEGESFYHPVQYVETDTSDPYYQELAALTDQLTAGCSSSTEKASAILGWIGKNITYSMASICLGEQPSQVYWVYVNRIGNCQGFTKLAGFMFSLAGIPNGSIVNDGHMWNVALLNGRWVMLDAQHGASAFNADYSGSSYRDIKYITFAQGDSIYIVDQPGEVKLAGVGTGELSRSGITRIVVPHFVTAISGDALENCPDLEEVVISDSVTSIGHSAFSRCPKLTSVLIPASVTEIKDDAFENSRNVTIYCEKDSAAHAFAVKNSISYRIIGEGEDALTLPSFLTRIESEAFAGLSRIKTLSIPEAVSFIADDAFAGTDAVLYVVKGSYAEQWAKNHNRTYIAH